MKFRRKPVVVEATQWFKMGDHPAVVNYSATDGYQKDWHPAIHTLEGPMRVSPGDWVITGVKGEHYACKPDIFVAIYEPADTPAPPYAVMNALEDQA